ncbi:unnamed protein product [Kuraishia capsulata CBS 1993]|uniref:Major facilitator superfamily (MFS) profile domain-containing protein n=1 Tax=Kuraishia capsulata CBS 1993 TaxID=1382522 RepID=W6MLR8_9ASCO|nr:uncharacterized protein KUCA_T00003045001 [Kuraishia capsulata CBS 1993]CDK27068.1 unnamed protein product [Kuraishia capsulata CBS 1993]
MNQALFKGSEISLGVVFGIQKLWDLVSCSRLFTLHIPSNNRIIMTLAHYSEKIGKFRERGGRPFQKPWIVFLVVATSELLDAMNLSVVATTLSQIQEKYNTTYPIASWALSSYALCFAGFIMIMGRIGDIIGHHIIFIGGLFALSLFLLIAAAVENLYVVIVFRALQGICAAATIPSSYAIIAHTYSGNALKMALAALTGIMTVASGIGFVIGGAFYESSVGYRGSFYLFFALCILSSVLSFFCVRHTPTSPAKVSKLDHLGVLIMLSGALLLVTGLTEGGARWNSPKAYVLVVIGVVLLILFLVWELYLYKKFSWSKNLDLLIPPAMWDLPNFIPLIIILGINYGSMFTQTLASLQIFQYVSLHSPIVSAVQTLPGPITMTILTFLVGFLFGKIPPKYCIFFGSSISLTGAVLFSRMNYTMDSYWRYGFPAYILMSSGTVFVFINTLNTLILSCPLDMQGLLSGVAITSGEFFVAAASAGVSSIVGNTQFGDSLEAKEALMKRYQKVFYLAIALSGTAFLVDFFVKNVPISSPQKQSMDEEELKENVESASDVVSSKNLEIPQRSTEAEGLAVEVALPQ